MAEEMFDDKVIPWIASSKSSDQKFHDCMFPLTVPLMKPLIAKNN